MSNFADGGERVEGADGLRIFFRSWRPKQKARGLIVIVPGFNAHSGSWRTRCHPR
jgi:alpha-beta hydrolase superfamily lysophospholipase